MKLIFIVLSLVSISTSLDKEVKEIWEIFKTQHQKIYKNQIEEKTRFAIFQENLQKILEHNRRFDSGLESYKLGLNHFADMTSSEFKGILTLKSSRKPRSLFGENDFQAPEDAAIPKSIDWREKGAVTNVKNQGGCGSCWSFAVTGALEGQYFRKTKQLVSFSEQNLIDCAKGQKYELDGCQGGQLDPAFQFIKDNGLEKESDYPYEMTDDKCRAATNKIVTKIKGYRDVKENNETQLAIAVGLIGPIAVAVDATNMQLYHSGVYNHPKCSLDSLNHGMLIVGYGSDQNGTDYWLVKNSWGLNFGEQGYIKMARGINQCGIAAQPSFPVL